jgi:hypothetical protein
MGPLFENNIRFETAQYVHARHGFDLSLVQFDPPALEVEFFQSWKMSLASKKN